MTTQDPGQFTPALLTDLRGLIAETRERVAAAVNAGMTLLYWRIGERIQREILKGERAEYGKEIVAAVARQLTEEFGSSFSAKHLRRMVQFAEVFPDPEIVAPLARQLSWSHFTILIPIDEPIKRDFYAEMCRVERWSRRTLRAKIDSMLFERTAISRKPDQVAKAELEALRLEDRLSPSMVFKDPYVLDFLGLQDRYLEKDLEDAILREIERFLLELGEGFAFVARQKRLVIDGEDFTLDLLFYHRRLRRLIAIELKLGRFKAGYKSQMELYLRWLEKHETQPGEESPLGIILCAETGHEQLELLQLDQAGIHVAQYLTGLPPKEVLLRRLRIAIEESRERFGAGGGGEAE
ncbi:MAG: PDDEXK nuclease domain-containing protein [Sumerlaeia bacterium]